MLPQVMEFMDETVSLDAWPIYFQQVDTPKEIPNYHTGYNNYISFKCEQLSEDNILCDHQHILCICNYLISDLIGSLNNKSAERLRNAHSDVIITIITLLLERIIR